MATATQTPWESSNVVQDTIVKVATIPQVTFSLRRAVFFLSLWVCRVLC